MSHAGLQCRDIIFVSCDVNSVDKCFGIKIEDIIPCIRDSVFVRDYSRINGG